MIGKNYHSDWEEFAKIDPKWAILTNPKKKYNKWNDKDFFQTGEDEIKNFINVVKNLTTAGEKHFETALDFGCGIGRLTRALSRYYVKVYGIDISEKMLSTAREINKDFVNIEFSQNFRNNMSCFESEKFDLIYSVLTLQHIPQKIIIKDYLKDFLRILKPNGLLYFQLPSVPEYTWIKSNVLYIRGVLYHLFIDNLGISREFCFNRLRLAPYMHNNYFSTKEITDIISEKADILKIFNDNSTMTSYLIKKRNQ